MRRTPSIRAVPVSENTRKKNDYNTYGGMIIITRSDETTVNTYKNVYGRTDGRTDGRNNQNWPVDAETAATSIIIILCYIDVKSAVAAAAAAANVILYYTRTVHRTLLLCRRPRSSRERPPPTVTHARLGDFFHFRKGDLHTGLLLLFWTHNITV